MVSKTLTHCNNCGAAGMTVFYEVENVPAHSVLLLPTREEAINYPTGQIHLAFCDTCGFISNIAFDPSLSEYAERYEGTQSFSPTFNAFAHRLATRLIDRYDLHNKDIIEIGCGQGEFLLQLCELGPNRGIGFDPAYRNEAIESKAAARTRFIADFYSERYTDYHGDFVCCKMTLEHIPRTADFVATVGRSIGDRQHTVVFFQIPNVAYILRDVAFWDIYYEHCSYFSPFSLARLFIDNDFDVLDIYTDYDDQYLMIEARPATGSGIPYQPDHTLDDIYHDLAHFEASYPVKLLEWKQKLAAFRDADKRVVIWGGGSKGVSFLTTLGIQKQIEYVVDINPNKHGMYMAGTGQKIVNPDFLKVYRPDVIIVMNPVYCSEIQKLLDERDIQAELLPVV